MNMSIVCVLLLCSVWLSHPIQAAQVFDQVFVSCWVVVDDSVLFVHTARLRNRNGPTVRQTLTCSSPV